MSDRETADPLKAWRAEAWGIESIVFAVNRAMAKRRVQQSAEDVCMIVDWCDIRAVRAPQYDHMTALDPRRCWRAEYLDQHGPAANGGSDE